MSIQDLVSKSLDTIRQEMFDRIAAVQDEYSAKGWLPIRLNLNKGIVRGMIELWCWGLWQLYQFLALVLKQAFPDTATGVWLDLHCKQVGVARREATKAVGVVYFTRAGMVGNVPIPAGRVVRTKPDGNGLIYRYVTTAAAVLLNGATEVAVAVEAEEYGAAANATVGQISEIVTVIPGVDAVENRADWITREGSDQEKDESLRERYQLAWKVLNGCTKYAYEAWAKEVVGVVAVKIRDQHPRGEGTVDVVIVGSAGAPTPALLASVDANINGTGNDDEKNPINDDVLVAGADLVATSLVAQLELSYGDPAALLLEAENRVRALYSTVASVAGVVPFGIGGDVTRDRLVWAMMLPGVKRVNMVFADVAVPEYGLATLTDLTLTYVLAAEA
uniref:Baseplate J family protein n=1 Tax=Geobacter sp. (strain M21) TaxID=443144 RepID=C6E6P5_GEOSM